MLLALVLSLALEAVATHARAQTTQADKGPIFLVATPDLTDPVFEQSVVLMLPPQKGDILIAGLIVNKPTQIGLHEIFPKIALLKDRTDTAYLGGPVDVEAPSVVFRSDHASTAATELFGGVYASLDPDYVVQTLKSMPVSPDLRLYLGRAQWAPEQLYGEIQEGSWYIVPADPTVVFSTEPGQVWHNLVEHAKLEQVRWFGPAAGCLDGAAPDFAAPGARSDSGL